MCGYVSCVCVWILVCIRYRFVRARRGGAVTEVTFTQPCSVRSRSRTSSEGQLCETLAGALAWVCLSVCVSVCARVHVCVAYANASSELSQRCDRCVVHGAGSGQAHVGRAQRNICAGVGAVRVRG